MFPPPRPAPDVPLARSADGRAGSSKGEKDAATDREAPRAFLTVAASLLIVLVTALVVSWILDNSGGAAPGLRKSTARPSILKDAGYVVKRTKGHKIERF